MPGLRRLLPGLTTALLLALPAAGQEPPQGLAGAPVNPPPGTGGTASQGSLGPPPVAPPPMATPAPGPGQETPVNPATGSPASPPQNPAPGARKRGGPAPAGPPPGAGPNRIDFQLTFPDQKGGGSAAGSAATLEYKRDDYAVLTGDVHLRYQDIELQSDRAEIDLSTKEISAQGNVILDQGPRRLTGTTLTFDLNTKTGKALEATAYIAPDYYFTGAEIEKTGDDTYVVTNGLFTSCSQKVPDWSFHLGRAEVQVEGYAHIHHATFDVKDLPILYTPYLLYPVKLDRASGLLVPTIRYTSQRGAALSLGYFQTLGDSYDTTFHLEPFVRGFVGVGDEFRYRPSEGSVGQLLGFAVRDPLLDNRWRWKLEWDHDTEDLPWGMRAVVHYVDFSDVNYFRDFERDFNATTQRIFDSRAFISGAWGPSLLNFLVDDRKTLLDNGVDFTSDVRQSKLPELEYRLRSTELGSTPLYVQFDGSADYMDVAQPGAFTGRYARFNLFPQLTAQLPAVSWLSLSVTGGEHYTYYGDSVDPLTLKATGKSLTRALPFGSAELVGPSFSKIFDLALGDYVKFKHVIEPRVTYTYQGAYTDQDRVPVIDEVDAQFLSNNLRVALDNRILAKQGGEDASSREVLLFELARNYSFDKAQPLQFGTNLTTSSTAGPIEALLRFNPWDKASLQASVQYNTLYKGIASTQVTGNIGWAASDFVGLTWYSSHQAPVLTAVQPGGAVQTFTQGDQIRLNTSIGIVPERFQVQAGLAYDFKLKLFQQQDYAINYTAQCYGLRLELRQFRALVGPTLNDREIRFALTLKNIGTVLDLNSRSQAVAP